MGKVPLELVDVRLRFVSRGPEPLGHPRCPKGLPLEDAAEPLPARLRLGLSDGLPTFHHIQRTALRVFLKMVDPLLAGI